MNSRSLSPEQLRRISRAINRHRVYLEHLTGRMHQTRFPQDDPLKVAAERMREAAELLCREIVAIEALAATK